MSGCAYSNEEEYARINQAFDDLAPLAEGLRERGYEVTFHGETHNGFVTCEIHIHLPRLGIPIESKVG